MSRKKVTRKGKAKSKQSATSTKRSNKKAVTSMTATLEKNLKAASADLIAQCRKEIAQLKAQGIKLQATWKKSDAQHKKIQKQCTVLAAKQKAKPSATVKKQLATAQIAMTKTQKILAGITTEVNAIKQAIKALAEKQSKHTAFRKLWSAFEKDWATKASKTVAAKPSKKAAKKPAAKKTTPETTTQQPQHYEPEMTKTDADLETAE
jgi:hypothetical protein